MFFVRAVRGFALAVFLLLPVVAVFELALQRSSYSGYRDRCSVSATAARPWLSRCLEPHLLHWSGGAAFQLRTVDRVNSSGHINDQDYVAQARRSLLAIVGDSFVDGIGVGFPASCGGRLQSRFSPARRVYTFSASGSPLSQYVHWIQEARLYRPDWYAILIVNNDIDESVYHLATGALSSGTPGWSRYYLSSRVPTYLRSTSVFPQRSATLLETYLSRQFSLFHDAGVLFGNLQLRADPAFDWRRFAYHRWAAGPRPLVRAAAFGRAVISAFLRDLARAVPVSPDRVAIVLTHITSRPLSEVDLYTRAWMIWRRQFALLARAAGHEVIDLEPLLRAEWRRRGGTIDLAPHDGHWPAWAHRICADAIADGRFLTNAPVFHY